MDWEEARGAGRNGRRRDQRGGLVIQVARGDEWLVRLENRGRILDRKGIPRWETTRWSVAAARRTRGRISRVIQSGLGMDYIYGKEGSLDLPIEI